MNTKGLSRFGCDEEPDVYPANNKEALRRKIQDDVRLFLTKGGKIIVIPEGVSAGKRSNKNADLEWFLRISEHSIPLNRENIEQIRNMLRGAA